VDDRILYLKDPKDSTKKFLDPINTFNKVTGYKINIQKISSLSIHNNEEAEKEIGETITVTIASKNKIPRNKFNEESERPIQQKL
jgi:hypothetical protein